MRILLGECMSTLDTNAQTLPKTPAYTVPVWSKAFHTRTRSHEKRNVYAVGVKVVHVINKTRSLRAWNAFSWLSECKCKRIANAFRSAERIPLCAFRSSCETRFTHVSLACETCSPYRKLEKRVSWKIQHVCSALIDSHKCSPAVSVSIYHVYFVVYLSIRHVLP